MRAIFNKSVTNVERGKKCIQKTAVKGIQCVGAEGRVRRVGKKSCSRGGAGNTKDGEKK